MFGAFSPINGSHFLLELPTCNTTTFQLFLQQFAKQDPEEYKIILLDNAAFHKAKGLQVPSNIHLLFLPPYAPELNPAEKVWWVLKRELTNRCFETIEALQTAMTEAINKTLSTQRIKHLCAYSYYQSINLA